GKNFGKVVIRLADDA
ncbi:hypothetical protein, partial [Salmonella enterica]